MAAVEGPILALISKRLRTLRKKYNRITDMEESISQGKTLNKEQEETLRSKPIVTALIDELINLRIPPPSVAEEINLPAKDKKKQKARKEVAEEENVTAKTDIEDCKISDGLNSDEVSKDDTSPSSESSEGVTPSPLSRKARRKRNAKKPEVLAKKK
ncbi:hypothetical protein ARALYDRAFT_479980 [Arabidopsis lyrata subsp. lyrata]|uniref:Uncharacterized protein n=1 Tax=Arabidopsis lyrata subsp. lyrata TaxID=81972 RepID=D7L574_ARALL|nr:hypothetical protein ARALYDRAFT_479980 [Arabidopsis lyrata subsp. lyrata]